LRRTDRTAARSRPASIGSASSSTLWALGGREPEEELGGWDDTGLEVSEVGWRERMGVEPTASRMARRRRF